MPSTFSLLSFLDVLVKCRPFWIKMMCSFFFFPSDFPFFCLFYIQGDLLIYFLHLIYYVLNFCIHVFNYHKWFLVLCFFWFTLEFLVDVITIHISLWHFS